MINQLLILCPDHKNQQITAIRKIPRDDGRTKMCQKCLINDRSIHEKDVIFINEFETEIAKLQQSLETIQHTQFQQLEILVEIQQEQDRLGQAISKMRQKKQSLDNFIRTSLSSLQLESISLSEKETSDYMQLFNQQELLCDINLELQRSLNPLRDLRTCLRQQSEKILQDIQSINQILNEEESIQQENQQQEEHTEIYNGSQIYVTGNSRIELPEGESFEQVNQNSQQYSDESLQNLQASQTSILPQFIYQNQPGSQYNQLIIINLVFDDSLARTFEVEINPYSTIRELAQEFKIVLNHQKEIILLYMNQILEEERSFKQLKIENGYTLQGQLKY
ncbi:unnamed protein product [Paramecium octaurelia]|uniref:Ubiquitin-like domain-containing protein n=1 Tax=Paramecium octaurelia TaxID=43137 RepID=A0A8S1TL59_PAROT|nr:unnamed protein product [Paramecium octaurelia]